MSHGLEMTAAEFNRRTTIASGIASVIAIGLISCYLVLLLKLPSEQWWGFGQIVGGLFVALFAVTTAVARRLLAPVSRQLDARASGADTPDSLAAAFARLSRMPLLLTVQGELWWILGGLLVAGSMLVRYESFTLFSATVMVLAAASGGFIASTFLYFVYKQRFAGLRAEFAREIGDPAARARLVRPVAVRHKLQIAVSGVTFVTVVFAMCLAYVASSRRLEARATDMQLRLLTQAQPSLDADRRAGLDSLRARARELSIASEVLRIDPETREVVSGDAGALYPIELRRILSEPAGGVGLDFDSPNTFAWAPLADGSLVVALMPWRELQGSAAGIQLVFAVMIVFSGVISICLARALAGDVGRATEEIRGRVERMASGDLRPGEVAESEDELGALARSFETMSAAVRETISRVAEAARLVGSSGGSIAGAAESVAAGAAAQEHGVQHASRLMEGVRKQVADVEESAQDLNLLVEESSSSILEMGAAGNELNDTAGILSSKVDEVSSSIEEMVHSVKQVAANTASLFDAAAETSGSMEEMASAMHQVNLTAEQTAQLSRDVVQSAESGQAKVRQTIEGMQSIRSATETAEQVIRGLGTRAEQIGAILDVIDDVADETNLLALNAAIISAQAGDHGRAFSVVADEIKELADRVLASTKEIGSLITSVQEGSSDAVKAIDEGAKSVASGVQLSMEAGASLEEITRSSRESGTRIQEIVQAVREQTKAAGHVVQLMERVSDGVSAIQRATTEQDRGNDVVFRSSVAMREVATQLRGTTEEQARGGARIRESIDGVRDAVEAIKTAIQVQSESNSELSRFLEQVSSRASSNEEAARSMEEATRDLNHQSETLHADVQKFQI